jgi:hypothetical protein
LKYIETDPQRKDTSWGWFHVAGMFVAHFVVILCEIDSPSLHSMILTKYPVANAQLLSLSNSNLKTNLNLQLNTLLYTKTLVRKDVPSNTNASLSDESGLSTDFSSKAEVMTLMTTDVGRARDLSRLIFSLTGALPCHCMHFLPGLTQMLDRCCDRSYHRDIHAVQSTWYDNAADSSFFHFIERVLLGVSTFVGLGITILMTPLNQFAGHSVVYLQKMVMSCRDERVALTNEVRFASMNKSRSRN